MEACPRLDERTRLWGVTLALVVGLSPSILTAARQLMEDARLWYVGAIWVLFAWAIARRRGLLRERALAGGDVAPPPLSQALPWIHRPALSAPAVHGALGECVWVNHGVSRSMIKRNPCAFYWRDAGQP